MTRAARVAMKSSFLGVALSLALVLPAVAADRPLGIGDRAPDLELIDQQGKPFKLAEALTRRDYIVLAFYVRAFSGG